MLQSAQEVFVAAKVLLFSPSELCAAFAAVVAGVVAALALDVFDCRCYCCCCSCHCCCGGCFVTMLHVTMGAAIFAVIVVVVDDVDTFAIGQQL